MTALAIMRGERGVMKLRANDTFTVEADEGVTLYRRVRQGATGWAWEEQAAEPANRR